METELLIFAKAVGAAILAGLVGAEREAARKPAGFRTHMLLAAAAALLVGVAGSFILETAEASGRSILQSDPLRIIQAIVGGVAFLGAGTIIREKRNGGVEGLTTAGSLLVVASIGVAMALDHFLLAVLATIFVLVVLRTLHWIERRILEATETED